MICYPANLAELVLLVLLLVFLDTLSLTGGTGPLALRSCLQLGLQTHQMVGTGAGVAQDDLTTLLAHLTVVLQYQ